MEERGKEEVEQEEKEVEQAGARRKMRKEQDVLDLWDMSLRR